MGETEKRYTKDPIGYIADTPAWGARMIFAARIGDNIFYVTYLG